MYKKSMNVVSRVAQVSSAIALAWVSTAGVAAAGSAGRPCQQGERGRLIADDESALDDFPAGYVGCRG